MIDKKTLGNRGEAIAARYYQEKGYKVLERNWHCRYGEIDLICLKKREVYFIEVKTRRSEFFGQPEEAIDARKVERMRQVAYQWLRSDEWNTMVFEALIFHAFVIRLGADGKNFFTVYTEL